MTDEGKREPPLSLRIKPEVSERLSRYVEATESNRNAAVNALLDRALTDWEAGRSGVEGSNP